MRGQPENGFVQRRGAVKRTGTSAALLALVVGGRLLPFMGMARRRGGTSRYADDAKHECRCMWTIGGLAEQKLCVKSVAASDYCDRP